MFICSYCGGTGCAMCNSTGGAQGAGQGYHQGGQGFMLSSPWPQVAIDASEARIMAAIKRLEEKIDSMTKAETKQILNWSIMSKFTEPGIKNPPTYPACDRAKLVRTYSIYHGMTLQADEVEKILLAFEAEVANLRQIIAGEVENG